ncbi:transcription initiation factor IID, 31kD subunit-domain-containing protein [Linnemannia elongata]|nr:transcription initiation factor IID, 31kD subunit-domain-containing protein [Linnemannia elongata]
MTQAPQPRDAKVISLILQSLAVEDADQKVIHQLLEFAHRYTTDVFQDALLYSEHAGRTDVGLDDVRLAIQGRVNHSFTSPPPKEFLLELAEEKNKVPLPLIPEKYGIRLPHERHCLTAVNFQLIPEVNRCDKELRSGKKAAQCPLDADMRLTSQSFFPRESIASTTNSQGCRKGSSIIYRTG